MPTVADLKVKLGLDDELSSGLESAGKGIQGFTDKTRTLGRFMALQVGNELRNFSQGLTRIGIDAVTAAADLQKALARSKVIAPDLDLSRTFAELNDFSTRVPAAANEVARGLENVFSSMDVKAADAIRLTKELTKGAIAADTAPKDFFSAIIGVMNVYKKTVGDVGKIQDVFFNTVNKGVITGEELARELGDVTKSAGNAGVSFEMLGAAIAASTRGGGSAAENITGLNNLLNKLTDPKVAENMRALGVEIVDLKTGKFRPLIDVVADLQVAFSKMSESTRAGVIGELFPDIRARRGLLSLMGQMDTFRNTLKLNEQQTSSTSRAFEIMAGTFSSQFELIKNSFEAVKRILGKEILDAVGPLIKQFTQELPNAIKTLTAFLAGIPKPVKTFVLAFAGFLAIAGAVVAAIISIGVVVSALGGPLIASIAAVAAFGAAWVSNVGGIRNSVLKVAAPAIQYLGEVLNKVKVWFQQNAGTFIQAIRNIARYFVEVWGVIKGPVLVALKGVWDAVVAFLRTAVNIIGGIFKLIAQIINGDWSGAWKTAQQIVEDAITGIIRIAWGLLRGIGGALGAVLTLLFDTVKRIAVAAFNIGKSVVTGFVKGLVSNVVSIADSVKKMAGGAVSSAKDALGIKSPSSVFRRIGQQTADGMVVGMQDGRLKVVTAAKALALEAEAAAKQARKTEAGRQTEGIKRLIGSLASELKSLKGGGTDEEANVAKRFNLVTQALRDRASALQFSVNKQKEANAADEEARQVIESLRTQIQQIQQEGKKFPTVLGASDALNSQIKTLAGNLGEVTTAQKRRQKQEQAGLNLQNAVENLNADLVLRAQELTATTDLETFALSKLGRAWQEASQSQREAVAPMIASAMAQQENNRLLEESAAAVKKNEEEILRNTDTLTNAINNQIGAYARLTSTTDVQSLSLDLLNKEYSALTAEQQKQVQQLLQLTQRNDALRASREAEKQRSDDQLKTTNQLTEALADQDVRIRRLLGLETAREAVIGRLNLASKNLTADQQKQVDQAVASEAFIQRLERFQEKAKIVADNVGNFFRDVLQNTMQNGFGTFFQNVVQGFNKMLIQMASDFLQSQVTKLVQKFVTDLFSPKPPANGGGAIAGAFGGDALTAAIAQGHAALTGISQGGQGAAQPIEAAGSAVSKLIGDSIVNSGSTMASAAQGALSVGGTLVSTAITGTGAAGLAASITAAFTAGSAALTASLAAAFAAGAATLSAAIASASAGGAAAGGVGGLIPAFASGGFVQGGTAALVGDRGPEIIVPRMNSDVIPNSGIGGNNITFNITTPDVAGFRRSQSQLMADALRTAELAKRRNR